MSIGDSLILDAVCSSFNPLSLASLAVFLLSPKARFFSMRPVRARSPVGPSHASQLSQQSPLAAKHHHREINNIVHSLNDRHDLDLPVRDDSWSPSKSQASEANWIVERIKVLYYRRPRRSALDTAIDEFNTINFRGAPRAEKLSFFRRILESKDVAKSREVATPVTNKSLREKTAFADAPVSNFKSKFSRQMDLSMHSPAPASRVSDSREPSNIDPNRKLNSLLRACKLRPYELCICFDIQF